MHSLSLGIVLTAAITAASIAPPASAAAPPVAAPPAEAGQLIQLASLGGRDSIATRMNDRGDMIGVSARSTTGYQAVVWRQGKRSPTALGVDGAWPTAINESGHITGYVEGGLFRWHDGSTTYLRRSNVASFGEPSINDRDQVAATMTGHDGASRAFVWQGGRTTMLPTPAGMSSRAVGLNNRGQVIGTLTRPDLATERAVLWQDGRMTELGTLGGDDSTPTGINDRGQVIGSSGGRPFRWQDGRMTDLLAGTNAVSGGVGDLNENGTMTGTANFGGRDSRPVIWQDGRMTDIGLPGHVGGGSDINDRGDVTGTTWPDPQSLAVPFRWRDGQTTLFPEPAHDIAVTVVGIDRRGTVGVAQETTRAGYIVLRSA